MANTDKKIKHRKAGIKAWQTIRSEKRKTAAAKTKEITSFITPERIEKIRHPESFEELFSWKGNRIVMPFDKTPPDIACGMFWELRWAYGCPLDCSYCFLRGTMRGKMKPQFVRTELVLQALDEAFLKIQIPTIFNAGELADSLMNPQLMEPIVDKFESQTKHRIFLLSKFGTRNIDFLTELPRKQVICGWSINSTEVAKLWEKNAALPEDRINAAALVKKAGYETRIRIDPIFPIENWKEHYARLVKQVLNKLTPDRIILGTPRGLWKTIQYAKEANVDMKWVQFFKEDTSWGKKLDFSLRKEIYHFMYTQFESSNYPKNKISICKETINMWQALGLDYKLKTCNCYRY
jgi:spore photoproduct lyase